MEVGLRLLDDVLQKSQVARPGTLATSQRLGQDSRKVSPQRVLQGILAARAEMACYGKNSVTSRRAFPAYKSLPSQCSSSASAMSMGEEMRTVDVTSQVDQYHAVALMVSGSFGAKTLKPDAISQPPSQATSLL